MRPMRHALACAAAILALPLAAAGCGSDDGSDGASAGEGTIKVGAIVSQSGPRAYGAEAADGARAYFAALNEDGGIGGREVELLIEDDGGDPSRAAAAARKLIGEGVVAIVGGASTVECQANAQLYAAKKLVDVIALPSNPVCFTSPDIVPISSGPLPVMVTSIDYLVEELGKKRIQFVAVDAPTGHSTDKPVQAYLEQKGVSAGPTELVALDKDPTATVLRVKGNDPDAIITLLPGPLAIGWVKAAAAQGIGPAKVTTMGGIYYDPKFPKAAGPDAEGLLAPIDFAPMELEPRPESITRWLDAMDTHVKGKTNLFLAQLGWIAADVVTEAIEGIEGEVTPAAVHHAVLSIEAFDNGMTGKPLDLANRPVPGAPNHTHYLVQIQDGAWTHLEEVSPRDYPPADFKPQAPKS